MLFRGWRQNLGGRASDCMYVFFTGLVGFVGAGTNFPLWFDIPIQPYGNILVSVYNTILGYGLYSKRISGIRLDLYKALVGLLLNLSATIFYLLLLALYYSLGERRLEDVNLWLHGFVAFFCSAIIFWGVPKLRFGLERILDGVFRREQNSVLSELKSLPSQLADLADEHSIAEITADTLMKTFEVSGVAVYRLQEFESHYRCAYSTGTFYQDPAHYEIESDNALIESLIHRPECIVLDQIYGEIDESYYKALVKIRNDLKVSVVIPIFTAHELSGLILLGVTPQARMWSEEENSILFNIGAQVGLNLRTRDLERRSNEVDKLVALGTMAAGLAHEIRNPLVSVQTLASLLQGGKSLDQVSSDFKNVILRDVKRIGNIVEGVALYSQNQQSRKAPVAIVDVIRSSLDICMGSADAQNVKVIFDPTPYGHLMVMASYDQLIQVFNNLIENGVHALQGVKKPTLEIYVERRRARFADRNSWVEIMVADNGPGVPASIRDRIFDPFITSKDTGVRMEKKGMGLGLAISKRIVENHSGAISVSNKPDGGAKFVVSLKRLDIDE